LELNTSDIEEVKENIGETDMQNSVLCPICKNCVKKRTEINEIECDACKNILCFY
jgi:ribosomal protein L37AE/L43A